MIERSGIALRIGDLMARRRGDRMSALGELVRSSRWKTGPRPLGSECCVTPGDSGREAYRAIAHGSKDSSPASRGVPTS